MYRETAIKMFCSLEDRNQQETTPVISLVSLIAKVLKKKRRGGTKAGVLNFDRGSASYRFSLGRRVFICSRFKNPLANPTEQSVHDSDLYIRTACRTNLVATSRAKYARCGETERQEEKERKRDSKSAPTPNSRHAIKPPSEDHRFDARLR